ncbi:glycosyltransferase [Hyphomicrobium facile]|uniref:Glycosyltransferase involved in cell wall bisynthesis n=1 Tax=Hyphomicrobium facile TaxID=51670 RepID=A0A1I7NWR2_9HYPH|nr:glycosyltransferase [Hyphomicrobium facile]SFV39079.1 Glycosyltransferase involved in cell wall bisynthesis [Hyphomicrobium facile]
MHVMHYHFGKDGGAERFFVHLVRALARRGLEQTVVIRKNRSWRSEIEGSANIIESNFRNLSPERILLPLKVKRIARATKPDALFAWATRASRLMPNYKDCIRISRLGDFPTNLGYFKNCDVLVCNTPAIGEHVRKIGWTRGVEVISNFTNTDRSVSADRTALGTPPSAPVVMSMGRFVERKGFAQLIAAVSLLPGVHLWLAGDGEERANLEKLATDLGMFDRTRFLGWQSDPRPYLAAADIFVMPSSHEPLGNVILEAWAQQKPVVSSRAEGPSWFMRDGENGLLVDIGDVKGLSNAIARLIADPDLAARIAENGSRTLTDWFSEEAVANAYIDLFKQKPSALA